MIRMSATLTRPRMIRILVVVAVVVAVALLIRPRWRAFEERRARAAEAAAALRDEVLSRRFISALPPGAPGAVRGAVMDWGVGDGLATLVALEDGTVSLYLNPGGGIIGAGTHANVARAAEAFRAEAVNARAGFTAAETFPRPGPNSYTFYLLTDSATLRSGPVSAGSVRDAGHPLAGVAETAQALMTEVRRVP
jgi:hypothetical protein